MEKKAWVQPLAVVENFMANEYVAACWGVVCDVPADATDPLKGIPDEISEGSGITHRKKFCGDSNHYQIRLDDKTGVPYEMYEVQTDGLGDLQCTIYTDSSFQTKKDIATVKANEYIYWTTKSGSKVWHHHGPVTGTSNHS
ncbi:MAG: hypothetical protein IJ733_16455 [Lachnospiraceae bacterium]|nr:hypothetical protein [Lachnospiraceae bacterium]